MIVLAYFLTQWFGFINGLGIASLCWLLSMVILDDRLTRREGAKLEAAKAALLAGRSPYGSAR